MEGKRQQRKFCCRGLSERWETFWLLTAKVYRIFLDLSEAFLDMIMICIASLTNENLTMDWQSLKRYQVLQQVQVLLFDELDYQPDDVFVASENLLLDYLLEILLDVLISASGSDSSLARGR
jgi:hypothetical protein